MHQLAPVPSPPPTDDDVGPAPPKWRRRPSAPTTQPCLTSTNPVTDVVAPTQPADAVDPA